MSPRSQQTRPGERVDGAVAVFEVHRITFCTCNFLLKKKKTSPRRVVPAVVSFSLEVGQEERMNRILLNDGFFGIILAATQLCGLLCQIVSLHLISQLLKTPT
eukprot:TRINITY_DN47_c0_g1_i1.p2 TRINITY_DN47_c0_g1~~TRINITY_DN47_c0_g1_i1.p2  ORF type:complete len:103 (+),score=8.26 TRINITY_DN47_c0_g1_i1:426-734(+)